MIWLQKGKDMKEMWNKLTRKEKILAVAVVAVLVIAALSNMGG